LPEPTTAHPRRNNVCRILAIGHDAGLGGAQLSLLDTLSHLDSDRYSPILLVPTPGPFIRAARQRGFTCYWGLVQRWVFFRKHWHRNRPWRLLLHPHLWAAISLATLPVRFILLMVLAKIWKIDLIYTNTVTMADGALLARILRLPHIWHLREAVAGNPDLDFPGAVTTLPDFILSHSHSVIVNSEALRRRLFGESRPENVSVISNGIDMDAFSDRNKAPLPADIPTQVPLTGICGNLGKNKGIDVYLRAIARLSPNFPDLHHLVIGAGNSDERGKLATMAVELGIGDRVHFLGFREDAVALFARLAVLVSTSSNETFGRTLVEAMAQGVPVVATRSGGPEEIIEDGKSGYLVDVGNVQAIADSMARLLADPELAREIGANGQLRARECFDVRKMAGKIGRKFDQAMAERYPA
jgi:glycosyltransferase involved in cell wall biosynthesis